MMTRGMCDDTWQTVREMKSFVQASAAFPYLLRLSSTLTALSDVSCFWMREFYLELCKRVQFPISMSLPAILIEHVLASGNGPPHPNATHPMGPHPSSPDGTPILTRWDPS